MYMCKCTHYVGCLFIESCYMCKTFVRTNVLGSYKEYTWSPPKHSVDSSQPKVNTSLCTKLLYKKLVCIEFSLFIFYASMWIMGGNRTSFSYCLGYTSLKTLKEYNL